MTIAGPETMNSRYRRARTGVRDELDAAAAKARRAGLSYGKFMALLHEGLLPDDALAPLEEIEIPAPQPVPSDDRPLWRPVRRKMQKMQPRAHKPRPPIPCLVCGNMFEPRDSRAKYCCYLCKRRAENQRAAARKREAKA
jgi:hypothetical protein